MNQRLLLRWVLLIAVVWAAIGAGAWSLIKANDPLVGVRVASRGSSDDYDDLASKDLSETIAALSNGTMWGIRRDGSPLPSPAELKAAEEKPPVVWRVLATRVKGKEHQLLIQVDKDKPVLVAEGESLPDGSVVKSVSTNAYSIVTPDDVEQLIQLNFE